MILGKLSLAEAQQMTFGMNVFGTTEQPSIIRFIIEGDKFDIACKCKQVGEDIEVDIPELKGILEAKEYPARLEVIIGDKIFTPLKESIEFDPLVELGVKKKSIKVQNEGVEIKVKSSSSKEVKKSPIDELKKDGLDVVEINGFKVIKRGEKYVGFLSENNVIKSKEEYNTLQDLVDAMSK